LNEAVLSFSSEGGAQTQGLTVVHVPQGGAPTVSTTPSGDVPFNSRSSSQLYGTLHLLLCLLRSKKVKTEIDPYFTRSFSESLVDTLLKLLKSYEECSAREASSDLLEHGKIPFWPMWLSPLCVLLFELATASVSVTETVLDAAQTVDESVNLSGRKKDESEEKTETNIAEEKECEVTDSVNDNIIERNDHVSTSDTGVEDYKLPLKIEVEEKSAEESESKGENDDEKLGDAETKLILELGSTLRAEVDRSSLLSEGSWTAIYDTISVILRGASTASITSPLPLPLSPTMPQSSSSSSSSSSSPSKDAARHSDTSKDIKSSTTPSGSAVTGGGSASGAGEGKAGGRREDGRPLQKRYLDPSSGQGVLLLLHALVLKQNLSHRFVMTGGTSPLLLFFYHV
jgi:hypothetical protein